MNRLASPAFILLLVVVVACSGQTAKPTGTASPASSPAGSNLSTGGIVEYSLPAPPVKPPDCYPPCGPTIGSLALGGDGNIWFVDNTRKVIGRITPAGKVTQFSVGLELAGGAQTIAAGPDGNLYVNASGGGGGRPDWILRVTPSGAITKLSAGKAPGKGFGTGPESITAGPDGNMWFTEFWTNRIGRLSPSGSLTEFAIPTPESAPRGIVTGPDGNLWFVEGTRSGPAIARITPAGVITEFPLGYGAAEIYPYDIVSGPDGNLWFTENEGIERMSTKGEFERVSVPKDSRPMNLVSAPDGNLWYTDSGRNAIVRLSPSGVTHEYALPRRGSTPYGLAIGADRRIWFGESGSIASIGLLVPEVQMSARPLVFADASAKAVTLRNTGNAALAISEVRVTGLDASLFAKGSDECSGRSLSPNVSCEVQVTYRGGGPSGIQTALLEINDNATGSPRRLSLVAQAPKCSLPVVAGGNDSEPAQGQLLNVSSARIVDDPSGGFVKDSASSAVRTSSPPALPGISVGYYDRTLGRWLPVSSAREVSPDGDRYAYFAVEPAPRSELHVVDVRSGAEKVIKIRPDFWGVVAFTRQGIYINAGFEGVTAGLHLVDPDTGSFKSVFVDLQVSTVDGNVAWLQRRNPADKLPDVSAMGGATNEVLRRDLITGQTVVWLYRPGTNMGVVGTAAGKPVVGIHDGITTTYWMMTAPNHAQKMDFPFTNEFYAYVGGFFGDTMGTWVGSQEGVYLWTPRTGGVLVTDQAVMPAGTCA